MFGEDPVGVRFGCPEGHPEVNAVRAYAPKTEANEALVKAIAFYVKGLQSLV